MTDISSACKGRKPRKNIDNIFNRFFNVRLFECFPEGWLGARVALFNVTMSSVQKKNQALL